MKNLHVTVPQGITSAPPQRVGTPELEIVEVDMEDADDFQLRNRTRRKRERVDDSSDENRDNGYRSQAGTENGSAPRRKVVHAQPVEEEDIQAMAKFLSDRKIQDPSRTHHRYRFVGIICIDRCIEFELCTHLASS